MHELLMRLLLAGSGYRWQEIWRNSFVDIVARQALRELDRAGGGMRERWRALDQPRQRRKLFGGPLVWDALTETIVARRGVRDAFDGVLQTNSFRQFNSTQFRTAVSTVVPVLLQRPVSREIVEENPSSRGLEPAG